MPGMNRVDTFVRDRILRYLIDRYYSPFYSPLDGERMIWFPDNIDTITLKNGCVYKYTRACRWVGGQYAEYDWRDMQATDTVLDIGSCVGAFCIPASKKAKSVIAVEPLFVDDLTENLELNACRNIQIIKGALGNGQKEVIDYDTVKKTVDTYSFDALRNICGGNIDFLKCDCEGAEQLIPLNMLKGIRRIEMEVHSALIPEENARRILDFIHANWDYVYETPGGCFDECINIHAFGERPE
jgi:FkbM family methyltransferase